MKGSLSWILGTIFIFLTTPPLLADIRLLHAAEFQNRPLSSLGKYHSDLCDINQYIVTFDRYLDYQEHVGFLEHILGPRGVDGSWTDIPRTNAASQFPTDFVLVNFQGFQIFDIFKAMNKLHKQAGIRYVTKERLLRPRSLLNFAVNDVDVGAGEETDPQEEEEAREIRYDLEEDIRDDNEYTDWGSFDAPELRFRTRGAFFDEDNSELMEELEELQTIQQEQQQQHTDTNNDNNNDNNNNANIKKDQDHSRRLLSKRTLLRRGSGVDSAQVFGAKKLWDRGFSGSGIKMAVFDTGIAKGHRHFRNIKDRTNWTNEKSLEDGLGHGTFVAGVIASQDSSCKGFAPDANLHIFRVFTNKQVSYTSWFLDAFNYAIHSHVNVLNLSIGGPDFLDKPFVDKVLEMSANKIIVVSAIGNDGPLYGTLNNPADQMDVIGVGGMDSSENVASFSSRGMTTHELPFGYGRFKPDISAFGKDIRGSKVGGGCRTLSGTSVASPVIAGAVVLLSSVIPETQRHHVLNPATLKQVITSSARRLSRPNAFEQGHGLLNLEGAYQRLQEFVPHASVLPSDLDLTSCPYMWPYCKQPLYYTSLPLIMNLTVVNSMSVSGQIVETPIFQVDHNDNGQEGLLDVSYQWSPVLWPWSGYLAVFITPTRNVASETIVSGQISFTVLSDQGAESQVRATLRVKVIPTPARHKRILWDQFHSLRYPSGYFPRDNLATKSDILDWNGDHPHTNFRELFDFLSNKGYHLEVLGTDFSCFDASHYGTLLLVDPEEEYYKNEILKMQNDVFAKGMNLIVLAEWYNLETMKSVKFLDENTRRWWTPATGGANIPALNDLLQPFGIAFGNRVYEGVVNLFNNNNNNNNHRWDFSSGSVLAQFPSGGYLQSYQLVDITQGSRSRSRRILPILGGLDTAEGGHANGGRVAVYGDSSCLDMNHRRSNNCNALIEHMLSWVNKEENDYDTIFPETVKLSSPYRSDVVTPPKRMPGNDLYKYSTVLKNKDNGVECPARPRGIGYLPAQPVTPSPSLSLSPSPSSFISSSPSPSPSHTPASTPVPEAQTSPPPVYQIPPPPPPPLPSAYPTNNMINTNFNNVPNTNVLDNNINNQNINEANNNINNNGYINSQNNPLDRLAHLQQKHTAFNANNLNNPKQKPTHLLPHPNGGYHPTHATSDHGDLMVFWVFLVLVGIIAMAFFVRRSKQNPDLNGDDDYYQDGSGAGPSNSASNRHGRGSASASLWHRPVSPPNSNVA